MLVYVIFIHYLNTLKGYEDTLAYTYHDGAPILGCQSIKIRLINVVTLKTTYDGPVALSAYSKLNWFGFSDSNFSFFWRIKLIQVD